MKHANHVRERVHVAQRCQTLAHALLLHPRQIHELHRGIRDFLGFVQLRQLHQPGLRHLRHAYVRRLPALGLDIRLRQNPKQCRLSYLWQSDNSCLHLSRVPSLAALFQKGIPHRTHSPLFTISSPPKRQILPHPPAHLWVSTRVPVFCNGRSFDRFLGFLSFLCPPNPSHGSLFDLSALRTRRPLLPTPLPPCHEFLPPSPTPS